MAYEKFHTWDDLLDAVREWGRARGINNPQTQALKWVEEQAETISEINHGRFGAEYRDGHGDALVSQIILADITGVDLFECLEQAYNEIKDRTGHTESGNFIKDE